MKRFLQIAGPLYVTFAIVCAHLALAPAETPFTDCVDQRCEMVAPRSVVRDNPRLDFSYSTTPEGRQSEYTIVAWSTDWCLPCRIWKKRELPALLKAGHKVTVRNPEKVKPPKGVKVKSVPTICLYYKGKLLHQKVYWSSRDILEFLDNRQTLKK